MGGQPRPEDDAVAHCYGEDGRICEVFVPQGSEIEAWNNLGCGECTAAGLGKLAVSRNVGPLYLMPDTLTMKPLSASLDEDGDWIVDNFGGDARLGFRLMAFQPQGGSSKYTEKVANRNS